MLNYATWRYHNGMGKLSKKDVEHVAKLANLPLKENEIEKFSKQLSKIVGYVDELNEVDTSKIEPTHQTTGLQSVVRKDKVEIEDCLNQKEALSGSEKVHNGYFVVPAILEGKRRGGKI